MADLLAHLPLPPSGNKVFETAVRPGRGGGSFASMHLSSEAKRYREKVKALLLSEHSAELAALDPDALYEIRMVFVFEVFNKGWPKTASTRVKKVDVSNRILLLENCLKTATGIDDSQNFRIIVEKRAPDDEEEGVSISMTRLPDDW